jgi:hypothetical protein
MSGEHSRAERRAVVQVRLSEECRRKKNRMSGCILMRCNASRANTSAAKLLIGYCLLVSSRTHSAERRTARFKFWRPSARRHAARLLLGLPAMKVCLFQMLSRSSDDRHFRHRPAYAGTGAKHRSDRRPVASLAACQGAFGRNRSGPHRPSRSVAKRSGFLLCGLHAAARRPKLNVRSETCARPLSYSFVQGTYL